MIKEDQKRLAEAFRQKHQAPPLLLLPNAWDAMSARVFEATGFDAIATTSGGVAWALGFSDGEKAPWNEVVAATERIVRTVRVPVTADIEGGYGETPNQVASSVAEIIRTGVVGINLEDSTPRADIPIRSIEDAVDRIRAARDAARAEGVPLVINARVDLYLKHIGDDEIRFAETVRRGLHFSVRLGCIKGPNQYRWQSRYAESFAARATGRGARQHSLRPFACGHVGDTADRRGVAYDGRIQHASIVDHTRRCSAIIRSKTGFEIGQKDNRHGSSNGFQKSVAAKR
jgi:hypothetical protein